MKSLDFFKLPNPSSGTMALGSTQHLTEMSTRNLPGGKEPSELKADSLTAICEPIVYKMWEPRLLSPVGLHGLLQGELYIFTFLIRNKEPPMSEIGLPFSQTLPLQLFDFYLVFEHRLYLRS
jgi:hypothetical protein